MDALLTTDKGNEISVELPPAITKQIPVTDRVPRKEVYPRKWAEVSVRGLKVPKGVTSLRITSPVQTSGLWL